MLKITTFNIKAIINNYLKLFLIIVLIFTGLLVENAFATLCSDANGDPINPCNITGGTFTGTDAVINVNTNISANNTINFSNNTTLDTSSGTATGSNLGDGTNNINLLSGAELHLIGYNLQAENGNDSLSLAPGTSLYVGDVNKYSSIVLGLGNNTITLGSGSKIYSLGAINSGTNSTDFNNLQPSNSGSSSLILNTGASIEGITGNAGYINLMSANNTLILQENSKITNQTITLNGSNTNTITMDRSDISGGSLNIMGSATTNFSTLGTVSIASLNINSSGIANINIGNSGVQSVLNVTSSINLQAAATYNINIALNSKLVLQAATGNADSGASLALNNSNNNLTLVSGAEIDFSNQQQGGITSLQFTNSNNTLNFQQGSMLTGGDGNTALLQFIGGNTNITINDNVKFTQNTPSINASAGKINITIYGQNHNDYNFNLSNVNEATINFDAATTGFLGFGSSNAINLSAKNNTINFIDNHGGSTPTQFILDTSSLKFSVNSNNTLNFTGGGTINLTGSGLNINGKINILNINNTNLTSTSDIKLNGSESNTININSKNKSVTITMEQNTLSELGTNNTLNLNYNPNNGTDNSYNPNVVNIIGSLSNFNNINLGLTQLNVNSYSQGNNALNISTAVAIPSENKSDIFNGNINFTTGATNFNNQHINVTLWGAYNYPAYSGNPEAPLPFTITLMTAGPGATLNGIDANNISINSSTFEEVEVELTDHRLALQINKCATLAEVLTGTGNCRVSPNPPTPDPKSYNDPNVLAIANLLEAVEANKTAVKADDINLILQIANSSSQTEMYNFLQSLEPVNNEVLYSLGMNNINSYNSLVLNQKGINNRNTTSSWVSAGASKINIKDTNYITGASNNGANYASGIERTFTSGQVLGVSAGYGSGDISGNSGKYNGKLQSLSFSVYHKQKLTNKIYIKSILSYSLNNFNLTRNIVSSNNSDASLNINNTSTSSPNTNSINGESNLYFSLSQKSWLNVMTYAGIAAGVTNMANYKEAGFGALNIKGFNVVNANTKAGIIAQKAFIINNNQAGIEAVVPSFSLEGQYSYYNMPNTTASFIGISNFNNNSFLNYSPKYSKLGVTPKFNLSYIANSNLTINLYSSYYFNKDFNSFNLGGELRFTF